MDSFPAEIQLMILRNVNFATLKALVHASPVFHATYLTNRSKLLTSTTIRQLEDKAIATPPSRWRLIDLRVVFKYRVLHVCVRGQWPTCSERSMKLTSAFRNYYTSIEQVNTTNNVELSVEDCISLLSVDDLTGLDTSGGDMVRIFNEVEILPNGALHFPYNLSEFDDGISCPKKAGHVHYHPRMVPVTNN